MSPKSSILYILLDLLIYLFYLNRDLSSQLEKERETRKKESQKFDIAKEVIIDCLLFFLTFEKKKKEWIREKQATELERIKEVEEREREIEEREKEKRDREIDMLQAIQEVLILFVPPFKN